MADCVGIDQTIVASEDCLALATAQLGQAPAFWGRYFKGPGNRSPIQYQASHEADFFSRNAIRVLPVARQTANVNRADHHLGYQDGLRNAAALLSSFGAVCLSKMTEIAVFLDAEIGNPLNRLYYQGWSSGLIDGGTKLIDFSDEIAARKVNPETHVQFVPCLYAHHNDAHSWAELGAAIEAGAVCAAAWIVFMDRGTFPIGPWEARFTSPYMPAGVRVAIAQRILDYQDRRHRSYDFNLANPTSQDWLLPRLVLPPPADLTS